MSRRTRPVQQTPNRVLTRTTRRHSWALYDTTHSRPHTNGKLVTGWTPVDGEPPNLRRKRAGWTPVDDLGADS